LWERKTDMVSKFVGGRDPQTSLQRTIESRPKCGYRITILVLGGGALKSVINQ